MTQRFCSSCLSRVTFGPDNTCPNCGVVVESSGRGVSDFEKPSSTPEPNPFSEPTPNVEKPPVAKPDANPYQSPQYFEKDTAFADDQPNSGNIAWILFAFNGRIPRRVYWAATISVSLIYYAAVFAIVALLGEESEASGIALLAIYVPMLWIHLAVSVKRWHDRDKSGFWVLISLIPCVGPIWQFIEVGCLRGTYGPNQYGPDPT